MHRAVIVAAFCALLATLAAAAAQTAHHRQQPRPAPTAPAQADDDDSDSSDAALARCEARARRNLDRLDHLGDQARSATERVGRFVGASQDSVAHVIRVGHALSEAIARRLDCHERQQAARATEQAIGGGVGTTSRWTSRTHANVRGSSSVVGRRRLADGRDCLSVTDVVIIDGEEVRAPRRMCRTPPSNRYVRA
jgi:surface antigen